MRVADADIRLSDDAFTHRLAAERAAAASRPASTREGAPARLSPADRNPAGARTRCTREPYSGARSRGPNADEPTGRCAVRGAPTC